MSESKNPRALPLWLTAIEDLQQTSQLRSGQTITWEWLEEHLGWPRDSIKFIAEIIPFRRELRLRGLFSRQQGEEGLVLLDPAATIKRVKGQQWQKVKHTQDTAIGLTRVETTGLGPETIAKLESMQRKCAWTAAIEATILRKRKELPITPPTSNRLLAFCNT
jgi:hypothetical protein